MYDSHMKIQCVQECREKIGKKENEEKKGGEEVGEHLLRS